MKAIKYVFILSVLLSCGNDKTRTIVFEGEYAEGQISSDTTFNGLIKFYDLKNHKLTSEAHYRVNVLDGHQIVYYSNGKKQLEADYKDDKQTGYSNFYDEQGRLEEKQFFYYGLRVGPSIHFVNDQPKEFFFKSFDNEDLFYLNYDSIGSKRIDELQDGFFFYRERQLQLHNFNRKDDKTEYFIYLVNPPKYAFTYSLCLIDSSYNVIKTLQTFDNAKIWDTFYVGLSNKKSGQFVALRLKIDDEINDEGMTTFKKLQ